MTVIILISWGLSHPFHLITTAQWSLAIENTSIKYTTVAVEIILSRNWIKRVLPGSICVLTLACKKMYFR